MVNLQSLLVFVYVISPTSQTYPVRLVGGRYPYEGRLEIFYHHYWGTVCDDRWTLTNTLVACRSLGYHTNLNNIQTMTHAYFGSGSGPIWLDDVHCSGRESNIFYCHHNFIGHNNCNHNEDISIRCLDMKADNKTTVTGSTVTPVTINHGECSSAELDIVLIVDGSTSEGEANFRKQLKFVAEFVRGFRISPEMVQIGLVTFSSNARNEFYLNSFHDVSSILHKLRYIHYIGGTTFTAEGLTAAETQFSSRHGARPDADKVAIVITDGHSNYPITTEREAYNLKQMGVKMIAIGVGNQTNADELRILSSDDQYKFQVSGFDELNSIMSKIKMATCRVLDKPNTATIKTSATSTTMDRTITVRAKPTVKTTLLTSRQTLTAITSPNLSTECPTCDAQLHCKWNQTCYNTESCMIRQYPGHSFTVHCTRKEDCTFMKEELTSGEIYCCNNVDCLVKYLRIKKPHS